ncbi:hypothetical protein PsYK624_112700 [Phanerochaete sordida]|uniref:Uncharacterized protein n=1 Tax=Phanerochaete sordida TaxID=48140 RepID=A0A9P3GHH2_9APHY|nr:hypothetical protein PsYK624_112700 [Phanerochaete sordida]
MSPGQEQAQKVKPKARRGRKGGRQLLENPPWERPQYQELYEKIGHNYNLDPAPEHSKCERCIERRWPCKLVRTESGNKRRLRCLACKLEKRGCSITIASGPRPSASAKNLKHGGRDLDSGSDSEMDELAVEKELEEYGFALQDGPHWPPSYTPWQLRRDNFHLPLTGTVGPSESGASQCAHETLDIARSARSPLVIFRTAWGSSQSPDMWAWRVQHATEILRTRGCPQVYPAFSAPLSLTSESCFRFTLI